MTAGAFTDANLAEVRRLALARGDDPLGRELLRALDLAKRYKGALQFYADEKSWKRYMPPELEGCSYYDVPPTTSKIDQDSGQAARSALRLEKRSGS